MRYNIGELMSIDAGRQDKASKSTVKLEKTFHELKKETLLDKFKAFFGGTVIQKYYIVLKFTVTSDTGNKHKVFIRLDPDFNATKMNKNHINIYCDCADFKYRSAYLLGKKDSLFLNDLISAALGNSINEAPKKVTTTVLCKHAFAALKWVTEHYSSIMKTI